MRSLILAATAVLALAGCGGSGLPPATDPSKGCETLKSVLDTWKRGGTPAELKAGSPSIHVYEPDWTAGAKLSKYDIDAEDGRAGSDLVLKVKLSLVMPDGKPRERSVAYTVAVASAVVVTRNE